MSEWQKQRTKAFLGAFGRFVLLAICAGAVASWLSNGAAVSGLSRWLRPARDTRRSVAARIPVLGVVSRDRLVEHYSRYLTESLGSLRADRAVLMVRLEVGNDVLKYQQNPVIQNAGASYRLISKGERVPIIAVSRVAHEFLEQMRITYVDPRDLPEDLLEEAMPSLPVAKLRTMLFVPEVSGARASLFEFNRNK